MSAPAAVGPADHDLVVSDWSILRSGDRVYVYFDGQLQYDAVRVVEAATYDEVTFRDPATGKLGQVERGAIDPSEDDQLALADDEVD